MAVEDAMILAALFRAIKTAEEIKAVFHAYDSVRRSRFQQVIDSSRGTEEIVCGQPADPDTDELRAAPGSRSDVIGNLDLTGHEQDALNVLRELHGPCSEQLRWTVVGSTIHPECAISL